MAIRLLVFCFCFFYAYDIQARNTHKHTSFLSDVFIKNNGQVLTPKHSPAGDVLFYYTKSNVTVFVTEQGYSIVLSEPGEREVVYHRADIRLKHSTIRSENVIFTGGEFPSLHFYHGLLSKHITDVTTGNTVIVKDVYPGVDWLWTLNNGALKHEFVVNIGADASNIEYEVVGANVGSSRQGIINYETAQWRATEGPVLIQYRNEEITAGIDLQKNTVRFVVPEALKGRGFVIDPPLQIDWMKGIDSMGTVFKSIAGDDNDGTITVGYSSDFALPVFPQVAGSFTKPGPTNRDLVIMKTDNDQNIIWATFFGGSGNDEANAVATSPAGIFITGYSESWDFPQAISGNFNHPINLYNRDGFIARFDNKGKWKWCTGYGGTLPDEGMDIKYYNGRVYVVGYTQSVDLPLVTKPGAYHKTPSTQAQVDGFIGEFDTVGVAIWSTYFGGTQMDYFTALHVDATGIYTTGYSIAEPYMASDIPLVPNGLAYYSDTLFDSEGMLQHFTLSGALDWSTYFGGPGNNYPSSIFRNSCGLFVCGKTETGQLPVTNLVGAGFYQPGFMGGASDGFLARFNPNTYSLQYCSYYGTSGYDVLTRLMSSPSCRTIATGFSNTTLTPIGAAQMQFAQQVNAGGYDAIMVGFDGNLNRYWQTNFGSTENDFGYGLFFKSPVVVDMVGAGMYNYMRYRIGGTYTSYYCTGTNNCSYVTCNGVSNRFVNSDTIPQGLGGGGGGGSGSGGGGGIPCTSLLQYQALIPIKNNCPNQCNGRAMIDTSNIGGCPPYTLLWSNGNLGITDTALCENYWTKVIDNTGRSKTIFGRFNVLQVPPAPDVTTYCNQLPLWDTLIHPIGGGPPYTFFFRGIDTGITCPTTAYLNIIDTSGCVVPFSMKWFMRNVNLTPHMYLDTLCRIRAGIQKKQNSCFGGNWIFKHGSFTANYSNTDIILPDTIPTGIVHGQFVLADSNGSCTLTTSLLYGKMPQFTVQPIISCTAATGNIKVTVLPDSVMLQIAGSYTVGVFIFNKDSSFFLHNSIIITSPTNNHFTYNNLPVDTYLVSLYYNGSVYCSTPQQKFFLGLLNARFDTVQINCGETKTLKVIPIGGSPPYAYQWQGGGNTNSIVINSPGTYTVTITDASGCGVVRSINILGSSGISAFTLNENTNPCQNTLFSSAVVTNIVGGVAPYSILWSNGATSFFTNLLPQGANSVVVYDAFGCSKSVNFTSTKKFPPQVTANVTNLSCYMSQNGVISLNITEGYPPYSVDWSVGGSGLVKTNLSAGTHSYTVTDSKGCSATGLATVSQPPQILFTTTTTSTICTTNTGSCTVNVTSGAPPLTINWSDGVTGFTRSNLSSGTYYFTIYDANNCPQPGDVYISDIGTDPTYSLDITPENCSYSDGSCIVYASGSTQLSITWSDGGTGFSRYNLSSGNYSFTISDNNGCTASGTATVGNINQLPLMVDTFAPSCHDSYDGYICVYDLYFTNLTYSWSNNFNSGCQYSLGPGVYSVTATNNTGCTGTVTVEFITPPPIQTFVNISPIACSGDSSIVQLSITGGTAPYSVFLSSSAWYTSTGISTLALPANYYYIEVIDGSSWGCYAFVDFDITEPPPMQVNFSTLPESCDNNNGKLLIEVNGGTPPYTCTTLGGTYTITGNDTIGGLIAGSQAFTISDNAGCTQQFIAVVGSVQAPQLTLVNTTDVTCFDGQNGSISISATGSSPFSAALLGTIPAGTFNQTLLIENLQAGNGYVNVTDVNGCSSTLFYFIDEPPQLIGYANLVHDIECKGDLATIYIGSNGGTYPVSNDGYHYLAGGAHTVTLTDANGCTYDVSFVINEPDSLIVYQNVIQPNCNDSNAYVIIGAQGGVGTYTLLGNWTNDIFTNTIGYILPPGNYNYLVTDQNNCLASGAFTINQVLPVSGSVVAIPDLCYQSGKGAVVINMSNGNPPYTCNGVLFMDSLKILGLYAGTYMYTVTDFEGCEATFIATITEPSPLSVANTYTTQEVSCFTASDAEFVVVAIGGAGNYTYLAYGSNGQELTSGNGVFSGVPADGYSITIIDNNGCIYDTIHTINSYVPCENMVETDTIACYGEKTGAIRIFTLPADRNPYQYSLNGGSYQYYNVFYGLGAGNYSVTVKDKYNCENTFMVPITQPDSIDGRVWLNDTLLPIDTVIIDERNYVTFTKPNLLPWSIEFSPNVPFVSFDDTIAVILPRSSVMYKVRVYADSLHTGCFIERAGWIIVINIPEVPNTFTPNGDGFNDYWEIDLEKYPHPNILIFSRWGEVVYRSNDYNNTWDGTHQANGKKLPDGAYYFLMTLPGEQGRLYRGDINIFNSTKQ